MAVEIKILRQGDKALLATIADGVFDHEINSQLTAEFLADPRHHLAVAMENQLIVGMASAVHYVHPDKHPQLFINEVAVADGYRQRGLGGALVSTLLDVGRSLGCTEAWVLTNRANIPAMRLYASQGAEPEPEDCVMFTFPLTGPNSTESHRP